MGWVHGSRLHAYRIHADAALFLNTLSPNMLEEGTQHVEWKPVHELPSAQLLTHQHHARQA